MRLRVAHASCQLSISLTFARRYQIAALVAKRPTDLLARVLQPQATGIAACLTPLSHEYVISLKMLETFESASLYVSSQNVCPPSSWFPASLYT